MDCLVNSSILLHRSFTDYNIYWILIPLYLFGVFLNAIFIYITIVEGKRNKSTDYTITILCFTELCNAITSIIKATFVNANKNSPHDLDVWFPVFDTLDFIYDTVYICLLMFLNATRLQVMKNIQEVSRLKRSKRWQWILPLFHGTLSCFYGLVSFLDLQDLCTQCIRLALYVVGIGLPWILFLGLNSILMVYTLSTIYKRRRVSTITIHQTNGRKREQTAIRNRSSQPDVAGKLIHQVFSSLLFQTFCIVIPYSYKVSTYFICLQQEAWYQLLSVCIVSALKPFLNPVGLGLLLKQRRNNLVMFIEKIHLSNQYNFRRMAVVENDYVKKVEPLIENDYIQNVVPGEEYTLPEVENDNLKNGGSEREQDNINMYNSNSKAFMKTDGTKDITGLHIYQKGQRSNNTSSKTCLSGQLGISKGKPESDISSFSDVSDEGSMKYSSSCGSFEKIGMSSFPERSERKANCPSRSRKPQSSPKAGGNTWCGTQGGKVKKKRVSNIFSSIQEQLEYDSEGLSDVSRDSSLHYSSSCGNLKGRRFNSLLPNRQERSKVYSTRPILERAITIETCNPDQHKQKGRMTKKHSVGLLSHTNSTISAASFASTIQDAISYF